MKIQLCNFDSGGKQNWLTFDNAHQMAGYFSSGNYFFKNIVKKFKGVKREK